MAYSKKQVQSMVIMGVVLVLFLGRIASQWWSDTRERSSKARTSVQLDTLKAATTDYFKAYGQWPVKMKDLSFNRSNIYFVSPSAPWSDGWGRQFIYTAPTNGTGSIVSFGRDGLPGGAEFDADLKVSLP